MADVQNSSVDRVNLVYKTNIGDVEQDIELPFRLLVCGDFTGDEASSYFEDQQAIVISEASLDYLFLKLKPCLSLSVENKMLSNADPLLLQYNFTSIADFHPENIINNTPEFKDLQKFITSLEGLLRDDSNAILSADHLDASVKNILEQIGVSVNEIAADKDNLGWLITDLSERVTTQLDEILHNQNFVLMESIWRGLDFLVTRVDFSENCEIVVLNVSKQALIDDFDDSPEVLQSAFYQLVYSSEFGQFGGRPYGAIIGNYEFTPKAYDVKLLQRIASVAAISHLPFIAATSAEFFSVDSYAEFSKLRDIKSIFEQPAYAKWNSFRATPDARYIGLTMPSFLLRQPYDVAVDSISYRETVGKKNNNLVWGNAAFAFATRLMSSFAKYRWCLNITGSDDGKVDGLGLIEAPGNSMHTGKIPTEIILTDKRETEVVAQGFIPLSMHKGDNTAAFYSAYSAYDCKSANDDDKNSDELSARLGAQIPYLLIISRISHYIKMMQREHIGSWTNRREIDQSLNDWLRQYVSDMDNPAPGVRSRRPLRKAVLKVREVEGKGDWFLTNIEITPHIKFMGNAFTLKETSKLEKS